MLELLTVLPSVVLMAVTSTLLYMYGLSNYTVFRKKKISGPSPLSFLGNLIPMAQRGFTYPIMEWKEKFGKVFGVYFGNQPVMIVSDLEMLKEIEVKQFHNFQNRWDIDLYPSPIDKGIFFEKGADWKRIRNIITPTFSSSKLKVMVQQINSCAEKLSVRLETAAAKGESFEVKRLLSSFTMDVILMTTLSKSVDSQDDRDDLFVQNAHNIFKDSIYTMPLVFLATLFPSMEKLGKRFGACAWPRDAVDFILKAVRDIVQERKHEKEVKFHDFLQLMLDAEMSDDEGSRDLNSNLEKKKKRLTEDEIIGQAFLFLIAGYETTASAIQYMAYSLATNPDVQEKVYEEINTVLGDEEPTYEGLLKLQYMEQVFNESLRKYPIVPIVTRECLQDTTVKGYEIEKGTAVGIPIYVIHYDPENFPNPEEFDPERFSPENKRKIHPLAFHPFGYGPRVCIGMRLAMMEAKCAVVHMLRRVKLVQCEETPIPIIFDNNKITSPTVPIKIKVEMRTNY